MEDDPTTQHDVDGAGYVDAATFALRFASVELGPAPTEAALDARDKPSVSSRLLRDTMGCLVTGVCVITTIWDGEDVAMTANSVTSVSLEPPLVLVCVAHKARFHEAIVRASSWGISILDADATEVSRRLAEPGRDRRRQLDGLEFERGPATGVALLGSSCASLECRTQAVYAAGDHSIVVGEVLAAEQRSQSLHPLVFHRGTYSWLGAD